MSSVKRLMEHQEEMQALGARLLLQTGALKECEFHSEILMSQSDEDAEKHAYALGANLVKSGQAGTADFKEMSEGIKAALDDATDGNCPYCEKAMRD